MAVFTYQRIISKGKLDTPLPFSVDSVYFAGLRFKKSVDAFICIVRLGIDTIVAKHVEAFFRYVNEQLLHKVVSMFGNVMYFSILVILIPVGDIFSIIVCDTGLCHGRSSDISCDIFRNSHRVSESTTGSIDIKAVITVFIVESADDTIEFIKLRFREGFSHIAKKYGHPGFAKILVMEILAFFPFAVFVETAFSNQHMYMRIPVEVTTEGMQTTDNTGSKMTFFIHFFEVMKHYLCSRAKKYMKEIAIMKKKIAKFLSNSENDMTMPAGYEFLRHALCSVLLVGNTAGVAES